jgi:CheY-like chemotaxis protein
MVLIVEDENISRHALERLLQLHGQDARGAATAEEAMRLVSRGDRPNVALVDINLPGMSGVGFVRRLHRVDPSVPCVFMTASDDARDEQVRSACKEPTLRKPLHVPTLLDLICGRPAAGSRQPGLPPSPASSSLS